jgi:hypothetical protein
MRIEVATAGNPVRAMIAALMDHDVMPPGSMRLVSVAHDPGCPCTDADAQLNACTCEIIELNLGRPR